VVSMLTRPFTWPSGHPAGEGSTPRAEHLQGRSTDARHRVGPARSSNEGSVMGLERRGRPDQGRPEANPTGEEPREGPKPKVKSFEIPKRLI
jgi:hypothetical protein